MTIVYAFIWIAIVIFAMAIFAVPLGAVMAVLLALLLASGVVVALAVIR